ncbi:MAG TPA: hypothetical protein PLI74_07120, partial [Candidatus Kapabacteria bacterium]|nr:hypothetical protein [Candidatus Kapabacteria bacterium]
MHKLSEEIDIALLKNQTVSHISFGINYILLSLDASSIQFSGPFTFKTEEKEYEREEVFPVKSDFGLLSLLEKGIESVYCNQ